MDIMDVTNLLLKRLYKSNLEVELELSVDETVSNAVQVQINVKPKHFKDFAIFYGTKDTIINVSSIFEINNINVVEAERLFNENSGPFTCFIYDDEDNFIHLYGDIELDRFYLEDVAEEIINDYVIDDIINYLEEQHELTDYLNNACRNK